MANQKHIARLKQGSGAWNAWLKKNRNVRPDLPEANLPGADLTGAILTAASLTRANFTRANLSGAILVKTGCADADLTGCKIFGISAWKLKLERTKQESLVITDHDESEITADNIEVAQFVYLLLHNEKIRDVIDTVTSKTVLILGRFTPERKAVLDALREELRRRDYLPILFDFDKPASRDYRAPCKTGPPCCLTGECYRALWWSGRPLLPAHQEKGAPV
jgi:Pentapeptide repeats (8 copies)